MIQQYTVIEERNVKKLSQEVNKLTAEGWKVHGSMTVFAHSTTTGQTYWYYQPLIRESNTPYKEDLENQAL